MMWLVLLILISILLLTFLFIEYTRLKLSRKYKHIPGIKEYPVIGNIYVIRSNEIKELNIIFEKLQVAPISKLLVTFKLVLFVSDPVVLQEILSSVSFCDRPYQNNFFRAKYGLTITGYKEWKRIRKAASPAFNTRLSLSFIPIFKVHFGRMCDELEPYIDCDAVDIYKIILNTAIGVIMETNLGQKTFDSEFGYELFEKYLDNVSKRIIDTYLHPDIIYQFSKLAKEDKVIIDKMYKTLRAVVSQREAEKTETDKEEDEKNDNFRWRRLFIDEMIQHSKEYKDSDLVLYQNLGAIFMAGYDTTSLTIANVVLVLAMHPKVDQRLEQELFENYHEGDEISQELFKRLPLLDCVIKETLRLFPPVPMSARKNIESVTLSKIGHVDKGTTFFLNFFNLHRWKHIWGEDAEQFNPDRFLPENSVDRHPSAFLPFSAGPRVCLGYQYAMISLKTALVLILSRYKFTTELKMEDLAFKFSITMKLVTQHLVRVHKRKREGD